MADPNQPMTLNKAITPVGTCTTMCPAFESVERIVQKMVDKSEKVHMPVSFQIDIANVALSVSTPGNPETSVHGDQDDQAVPSISGWVR